MMPEHEEPPYNDDPATRWIIDQREYMGLVAVMVRARAAVKAMHPIGDGSVKLPPRIASDLRGCVSIFDELDLQRRFPCRAR